MNCASVFTNIEWISRLERHERQFWYTMIFLAMFFQKIRHFWTEIGWKRLLCAAWKFYILIRRRRSICGDMLFQYHTIQCLSFFDSIFQTFCIKSLNEMDSKDGFISIIHTVPGGCKCMVEKMLKLNSQIFKLSYLPLKARILQNL